MHALLDLILNKVQFISIVKSGRHKVDWANIHKYTLGETLRSKSAATKGMEVNHAGIVQETVSANSTGRFNRDYRSPGGGRQGPSRH